MKLLITRRIEKPVEEVFQVFTDLARAPERVQGIESLELLTDGPMRVGTRFRETRKMFGREATEEMTVTALEPNRSYTVGARSCGCDFETQFRFHPEGKSTRVEMELKTRATTLVARLMAPLGIFMAGSMKKLCERDIDDLKAALEGTK